jgi:methionine-rich copper-binding protein CopC
MRRGTTFSFDEKQSSMTRSVARGNRSAVVERAARIEGLEQRLLLATNAITVENQLPGTPQSTWDVNGAGDATIRGFATDISKNVGQTISFKINDTANAAYHIDVYRMGYYQGNGARLVATIPSSQTLRQVQPAPLSNPTLGLVDCGNWAVSASWQIPSNAVSGIYFARVVRDDTGGASHIVFIVRNDASTSDLLFQTSDTTWQAYNDFGNASLYEENNDVNLRAFKVSYNRPLLDRGTSGGLGSYNDPFHAEYPMVRWIERNGYDVSYFTDVDSDRNGALIKNHKTFMSVGHDEYWSGQQRTNVEAARDAGVNLAFFSGNEIFWKVRWENSIDASGTPYRTLVTYKESKAGAKIDPNPAWTGTWRDDRFSPPYDGGRPENALSGTIYMNDRTTNDIGIGLTVPGTFAPLRFWRNTSVASLGPTQSVTLGTNIVGYEVDEDLDNGFRPAGAFPMSSTSFTSSSHVVSPWGSDVGPGSSTHSLTLYRAPSGALVFGSGTVQWSWGLDGTHIDASSTPVTAIQQATVNLFADMGVQPASLQSGLVAATKSTDLTTPTSSISSPTANLSIPGGASYTVSGTAADTGGGVVTAVEVSVDGGVTWHRANGRNSWTYVFTPNSIGAVNIKTRAVDDSGNLETPSTGVNVTFTGPISFWAGAVTPYNPSEADSSSIEVGVKFRTDVAGYITGLRFYKGSGNTGTHVGSLWTGTGTRLANATFVNESATGWQQVLFSTPVPINPNTTYVASYHANNGHYSEDEYGFMKGVTNGPLHALAAGVDGFNGVYAYASSSVFPTQNYLSANYYVDILFNTTATDTTPPNVTGQSPSANANNVAVSAPVIVTFGEPINPSTISMVLRDAASNVIPGTLSYNSTTNTETFTPASQLATNTTYTVTVSGAKDLAGNSMTTTAWSFTTAGPIGSGPFSIWASPTPGIVADGDASSTELGIKFRSDVAGVITGIRYYKATNNTGTHTAHLWSSTGALLASATFINETSSGWQQVTFSSPVAIAANTTYVASYHAPNGHYAEDEHFFDSAGVDNGPLHALKSGVDGFNGVYDYGPAGTFPTSNWFSSNYWVDVVLATSDLTPPTVTAKTPAAGATGVPLNTTVTATFSESIASGTVFTLRDAANNAVAATVTYNDATRTATLTPAAALAPGATYTASVSGAKDAANNVMAGTVTWSFTTTVPDTTPPTVTGQTPAPGATGVSIGATVTVTFGESVQSGTISLVLKDAANNTIPGTLTYNDTTRTATFTPTSTLSPSTTYTATVSGAKDPSGNTMTAPVAWSFTTVVPDTTPPVVGTKTPAAGATNVSLSTTVTATFNEAVQSGTITFTLKDSLNNTVPATLSYNATTFTATLTPLSALANGGTYTATVSGAKDLSNNTMAAPVTWSFTTVPDTTPPTITGQTPAPNATGVATTTTVTATFSEAIQPATVSVVVTDPSSNVVAGAVAYDAASRTATFTPSAALAAGVKYTVTVGGARDLSGNPLAAPVTWSFTTSLPFAAGPFTVFSTTTVPPVVADPDNGAVELGMKFRTDVAGVITGVRFYKSTANTGVHVGNLWSSTGTLLGTVTFANESASGWQQAVFAAPIAVNANTTYVISYHTNVGKYSTANGFFTGGGADNGPLHALASGIDGANGVYAYGAASAFPANSFEDTNYYVDAVFSRTAISQTTAAQFNSGTSGDVAVTTTGDGELQLASGFRDDFNGTTLNAADWTTTSWAGQGGGSPAITVSGGILNILGAQIRSTATVPALTPVEGRVTIAAAANRNFGLATDLTAAAGNYWAVFTTGTTTNSLYARVNVNGTLTDVRISALPSGYHTYRVTPIATGFQFWLDGTLRTTINQTFPAGTPLKMVMSSFTGVTPQLRVDWIRQLSNATTGTFTSTVFDAGRTATWGNANWTANLPAGTSVLVEVRGGNTAVPDGLWSGWTSVTNGGALGLTPSRYLQYRVTLTSTDPAQTPTVYDVLLTYT